MSARATLVRNTSDATLLAGICRTGEEERPDTSGGPPESGKGSVADDPLGIRNATAFVAS
jgi:hypothetical protein